MGRKPITASALVTLGVVFGVVLGVAIATAAPDFVLRGGRFRPLSYAELNPAQKALADGEIASGRKSFDGPTNMLLRSPEMAKAARPLGRYLRFEAPMEHKLKEIAILLTARFWGGQYVWYSHRAYAIEAGLAPAFIDAMAAGKRPEAMSADEAAVYDFCSELLATRQVGDATFKAFVDRLGERAVVELVSLMGHYHGTTALFAVDRYPLPNGAKSEIEKPM
jgi:4-carboxymuconolactone decarboxylase